MGDVSEELRQFILACRTRALQDEEFGYRTNAQATRLVIQIEAALKNKKNRKAVLQAITGLPISSQNELTFWYHSVLIEETLEGRSDALLREIEMAVEGAVDCEAWSLYAAVRPVPCVPDMQQADPTS